jgi:hypothetical protein
LIFLGICLFAASLTTACGENVSVSPEAGPASVEEPGGKTDSGWLGGDTFEVNAVVWSVATQQATGQWEGLATDEILQTKLVDNQIKFIKNTAEGHGWRFNQLAEQVIVFSVETNEENVVQIEYAAIVDMLGRLVRGKAPTLDQITPRIFDASVPADPVDFSFEEIKACAKADDGHSAAEYNFHYYFRPDLDGCDLPLTKANVEITEVFERPTVYPEYDQLLQPLGDEKVGFRAALVPNRGDSDPLSRFTAHAKMLEEEMKLEGVDSEDEAFRRYTLERDGATMIIDLYNPTKVSWSTGFDASFRERLSQYTLIHYNGHSSYGTKHLLDDPESFTDQYQIIMLHSCQSYAYYTRQIFRAKASEKDPTGFALADVVATGKSSYPSGSPPTVRVLLTSLMEGMAATNRGQADLAPDWLTVTRRMKGATFGDIMYGVAGVRTNTWQPPQP